MIKIGEVINDTYIIEENICFGASGAVFKAYHIRLKKAVVIKQIRDELRYKINERREIDILKNLKHSYIPQVYDIFEYDGELYSVIEYIVGTSLADELKKRKRFPQKRVIKWAIQLCEALSYLHSRSIPIIHSDIKPDNIMLNIDDNICLIDFNVSLMFSNDISSLGYSEGYSSPEQASLFNLINRLNISEKLISSEDKANNMNLQLLALNSGNPRKGVNTIKNKFKIDERADIYSLGASLYHLMSGSKLKCNDIDLKALSHSHIKIDKGLCKIIEKATKTELECRYQTSEEMLKDLKFLYNNI